MQIALVYLGSEDSDRQITTIDAPEETVLFLDALDEDVRAIRDHRARVAQLMDLCRKFSHVVITCRTQFFSSEEEIPKEAGIAQIGPRKAGQPGTYRFWRFYLFPFDNDDIRSYLRSKYPFWKNRLRRKAEEVVSKIPSLVARPMLLAHVPELVESDLSIRTSSELYEIMVNAWMEREEQWSDKIELRVFSERLAANIFANSGKRGGEHVPRRELVDLARQWNVSLRDWSTTQRSLLNRDADDNYKFAHRSILEFFVIIAMRSGTKEIAAGTELTDMMRSFAVERRGHDAVHCDISTPLQRCSIRYFAQLHEVPEEISIALRDDASIHFRSVSRGKDFFEAGAKRKHWLWEAIRPVYSEVTDEGGWRSLSELLNRIHLSDDTGFQARLRAVGFRADKSNHAPGDISLKKAILEEVASAVVFDASRIGVAFVANSTHSL